jgi:flagellar biosynthesis/type III secretory pathway ATPase
VVLSRKIAAQNRYPAVDVLESVSRLFTEVTHENHQEAAGKLRKVLAVYKEKEDLINIGAYQDGSNKEVDYAKKMIDSVLNFLRQKAMERTSFEETIEALIRLMKS